jgi:aminoglycoside 3-N-acetyltransferase
VKVRPGEPVDLPALVEIYNEAIRTTTATFDTVEKKVEDRRAWFDAHGPRAPLLVAEEGDAVLGYASLLPWSDRCAYSGTAETAVYVDQAARGKGVGTALMQELMARARDLGLRCVVARITEGNEASVSLHRRHGFRTLGVMRRCGEKFGRLLDVTLMQAHPDRAARGPVVRSQLAAQLRKLGVAPGDTVMLHAALGQLGWILGGPDVALRALLDVLGPEGTVMMYTAWESTPYHLGREGPEVQALAEDEWPAFDPATSPADRRHSILAEYLRTWPGARRSPHPEGGMTAVGGRAEWLTAEHPLEFGYGPGTPLARLVEVGGKVLMMGAPLETITLLHHAEHLADLPDKRVVEYRIPVGTTSR